MAFSNPYLQKVSYTSSVQEMLCGRRNIFGNIAIMPLRATKGLVFSFSQIYFSLGSASPTCSRSS